MAGRVVDGYKKEGAKLKVNVNGVTSVFVVHFRSSGTFESL